MWVAIVIAVLALLMVAFMPKPNIENARAAKLGDFSIPRAKWGDPYPLAWGRVRQKSPITLWYGDLNPVPVTKKVSTGLFSSKRVTVAHKYYLGLDLLLCAGPGVRLRRIWSGTKEIWTGLLTTDTSIFINLPDLFGGEEERGGLQGTMRFYTGAYNTAQNAYLQNVIDADVPAYNGKARAVFEAFYFGTTTAIDNLSFELEVQPTALDPATAIMPNGADINAFEICYDAFITKWARFGNDVQDIDLPSWLACAQTVYDEGLGASMLLQSAITGKDFLEEIMRHVDGLLYQDPGTSKIVAKLIRNDYDPALLPVYDESVIESISNFSKTTWENTFNQCRVQFKDRQNSYDESIAIAQDFANINFQQRVKSTDISMPLCYEADVSNTLAARQLAFLSIPLYKCDIVCNRKAASLRPGSVFKLSWGPYGLFQMIMRVSKISLGTLTDGRVRITCVQDRYAAAVPVFAPPDNSGWTPTTTSPVDISTYKLFPAPYWLGASGLLGDAISNYYDKGRMYSLAEAPGGGSLSYFVTYGGTGNDFSEVQDVLGNATYNGSGQLVSPYSATAGGTSLHDTVGFTVTGVSPAERTLLVNNSAAQARDGTSLLLINDEFFAYVGFVDNGDGTVTFPNVYRAMMDTEPAAHAAGDRVWFVSGYDGQIEQLLGNSTSPNHYFKQRDQTALARMSVDGATTRSVKMSDRMARPLPPDYLTIAGSRAPAPAVGATIQAIEWRRRGRNAPELRYYDDAEGSSAYFEAGVTHRVRWRVGAGGYTTVSGLTGNSTNIDVTGLVGTLEVLVDSYDPGSGLYSLTYDRLTRELT